MEPEHNRIGNMELLSLPFMKKRAGRPRSQHNSPLHPDGYPNGLESLLHSISSNGAGPKPGAASCPFDQECKRT